MAGNAVMTRGWDIDIESRHPLTRTQPGAALRSFNSHYSPMVGMTRVALLIVYRICHRATPQHALHLTCFAVPTALNELTKPAGACIVCPHSFPS